ncbi:MAG: hypothetical protein WBC67_00045 [Candidatus Acidiferrales bacterium]
MHNRWVVQKRNDMLVVILYSFLGLILVTGLITLVNYLIYTKP